MITWMRPSGTPITTNDKKETIAFAESLGWKREGDKPKRVRRSKEQIEADNAKEG